jgi:phosphoribosylamine---glycine ligase
MKILVLGSGGREHALTWKINQSPKSEKIYVAPGNAGTAQIAENIDIPVGDFPKISQFITEKGIDLLVVGPENPLVDGIVDFLRAKHPKLKIVGPDRLGAKLEGSKEFAKLFMTRYGIPTGDAQVFNASNLDNGLRFLEEINPPYVLKADGLAAGKGVIITSDLSEAQDTLKQLIDGQFGAASANVLIEEFLDGVELSVFVLTDGKNYVILPEAKDYKRIGEGDTGPNTGGMGAISPVVFAEPEFMKKIEDRVIKPTVEGISEEGFDYCGFIFFGLINVGGEPFVIEYNVRMGDPETQAVLPRIHSDFLELLVSTADKELDKVQIDFEPSTAATVVMVSEGYPGSYEKGKRISLEPVNECASVFHAGTSNNGDEVVTNGGRVIAVTGMGENLRAAQQAAYAQVEKIQWEGATYRKDIGKDLTELGQ